MSREPTEHAYSGQQPIETADAKTGAVEHAFTPEARQAEPEPVPTQGSTPSTHPG